MLTFEVVPPTTDLLARWQAQGLEALANMTESAATPIRRLLSVGELQTMTATLQDVREYVDSVRTAVEGLRPPGTVSTILTEIRQGLETMIATGATTPPEDDDPAKELWDVGMSAVYMGRMRLVELALLAAPKYATIVRARKIIEQMQTGLQTGTLLVLRQDGVAIGAALWGDGGDDVDLRDLVASPAYIASGGKGVARPLIARIGAEALSRGGVVSLVPLDEGVRAAYKKFGFRTAGPAMILDGTKLKEFVAEYNPLTPV
ncbi:GNAT family N-acetyltransferase [Actinocrispum wychmicini]|uniref:Acetyltransferase (GNAT) family protein n=1 Tax=Actinocrispum wychmicini TaxID=1213861 RepID=A0A4V2S3Q4_9PSEU|nr:GNAT family N-acetyltransferase [Actinocrispum wychmicini]TCO45360.1 hypothetical protein EV192_121124 [Actinocrispum wychmicini]